MCLHHRLGLAVGLALQWDVPSPVGAWSGAGAPTHLVFWAELQLTVTQVLES